MVNFCDLFSTAVFVGMVNVSVVVTVDVYVKNVQQKGLQRQCVPSGLVRESTWGNGVAAPQCCCICGMEV